MFGSLVGFVGLLNKAGYIGSLFFDVFQHAAVSSNDLKEMVGIDLGTETLLKIADV